MRYLRARYVRIIPCLKLSTLHYPISYYCYKLELELWQCSSLYWLIVQSALIVSKPVTNFPALCSQFCLITLADLISTSFDHFLFQGVLHVQSQVTDVSKQNLRSLQLWDCRCTHMYLELWTVLVNIGRPRSKIKEGVRRSQVCHDKNAMLAF